MERARGDRVAVVVDDDPFVVAELAELLTEDGYDVVTATNGFSALRQVMALHPAVVVLDLVLPERTGADILHELRSDPQTRDLAILILTGYPGELSPVVQAEADAIVGKPFDIDQLMSAVRSATQRAVNRRAEVAPLAGTSHHDVSGRPRRSAETRHLRGRP
jgi:CheY-like chemotaxis protein